MFNQKGKKSNPATEIVEGFFFDEAIGLFLPNRLLKLLVRPTA